MADDKPSAASTPTSTDGTACTLPPEQATESKNKKPLMIALIGIGAATILAIAAILISTTLTCDHEWKYATCTEPKTCELCGVTEGEPLDHVPGHTYSEIADSVTGTVSFTTKCVFCEEICEQRNENINPLVHDQAFIFTPNEFAQMFEDQLNTRFGGSFSVEPADPRFGMEWFVCGAGEKLATISFRNERSAKNLFEKLGPESADQRCSIDRIDIEVTGGYCIFSDNRKLALVLMAHVIQAINPGIAETEYAPMANEAFTESSLNGVRYISHCPSGRYIKTDDGDLDSVYELQIKVD